MKPSIHLLVLTSLLSLQPLEVASAEDLDGDGFDPPADCNDSDPTVHPGAGDAPDEEVLDRNCDGMDGDISRALFVSTQGSDASAGAANDPLRTIQAALDRASLAGKDHVYVSDGEYTETVVLRDGISLWGGFSQAEGWARSGAETTIRGSLHGQGMVAVVGREIFSPTRVEAFTITTLPPGDFGVSCYGVLLDRAPGVVLGGNFIAPESGAPGRPGDDGVPGSAGQNGGQGSAGACDGFPGVGGVDGTSPCARNGGRGGRGGIGNFGTASPGEAGGEGFLGSAGGQGGSHGVVGQAGGAGGTGFAGFEGAHGSGGGDPVIDGAAFWRGSPGESGAPGSPGNGGGGGGGGGGEIGMFSPGGGGNGGGGGGGGGCEGGGGSGGGAGGGSFGVLAVSSAGLQLLGNLISSGRGGDGGPGGRGGDGGDGGSGGAGGAACTEEVGGGGSGGAGGRGGAGGHGGGGAGGDSFAIYLVDTPAETSTNFAGSGGAGEGGFSFAYAGAPGRSGPELSTFAFQIDQVSPGAVTTEGGDVISIHTTDSHRDAIPRIGGLYLVNARAVDPTTITGETPPLAPGLHDLELVAAGGGVLARLPQAILAQEPTAVTLTSVAPFEVATGGGTVMTLTGTGFHGGLVPRLGGFPLTGVEVLDAEHLRGVSPPLDEGLHAASLEAGGTVLSVFPDAATALPSEMASAVVLGRPGGARFAAGTDRITIPASGVTGDLVLRVGGVPVLAGGPVGPCGLVPGDGAGAGLDAPAGGSHVVLEGLVPDLPPGTHAVDLYQPGFGVVATLDEAVEVVATGAPPALSHIVSPDVLPDGSTRLHIFGHGFGPESSISVAGRPLVDPRWVSSRLVVGRAPALDPGEEPGPRNLELADPRGSSVLAGAVVYVGDGEVFFVRGDANASGGMDISDAITILGYLFLGSPAALQCSAAGDIDDAGTIDISDAVQLLNYLFLGGASPAAPFPDCGAPRPEGLGCAAFEPCGEGRGAAITATLRPNVFRIDEVRSEPGYPVVRDLSPITGEVVIDDPPGGVDLQPGDIIVGYTPLESEAIHEGVTYLLRLEDRLPGSCLSESAADSIFAATTADLVNVFESADLQIAVPFSGADIRQSSEIVALKGKSWCNIREESGADERGVGAGLFTPLIDVDFEGIPFIDWQDGPNYIRAGFYKLRVLYSSGDASLGVGISSGGLTGLTFFSGLLLDSDIEVYVDSHFEKQIHEEKKLLSLRRDHIVLVLGVPIHFAVTGDLYVGVDANAQLNLHADAGAKSAFKAGIGCRFDGERLQNLSGIEPPTFQPIPDTPYIDLNGFLRVKGYVRPEVHMFAGLLIRGVTADLGIRTEVHTTFHAEGETQPVPCFQWGVDAGMTVTINPEIQLFGYDLFDRTFDVIRLEEENILGDSYGCKYPPVVQIAYSAVRTGADTYDVHLDASGSHDPDGGPLRFRWDFEADGLCDRATLGNPRTLYQADICDPGCYSTRLMKVQATDDEGASTTRAFRVKFE